MGRVVLHLCCRCSSDRCRHFHTEVSGFALIENPKVKPSDFPHTRFTHLRKVSIGE